jgi:hypothetical protein
MNFSAWMVSPKAASLALTETRCDGHYIRAEIINCFVAGCTISQDEVETNYRKVINFNITNRTCKNAAGQNCNTTRLIKRVEACPIWVMSYAECTTEGFYWNFSEEPLSGRPMVLRSAGARVLSERLV